MAHLLAGPKARVAYAAALLSCVLSSGCVTLKELCSRDCPPRGTPCQVVAQWETQVAYAADPVRGGALTPGLAGRLYLFGPTIDYPMACDGTLTVKLFNQTGQANCEQPLETWRIDPLTLARLGRKGGIGWGYSLFLPWATYKPEINQIRLVCQFEPTKGSPLFADNPGLRLGNGPIVSPRQVVQQTPAPVAPQQPAAPVPATPTPTPTLQPKATPLPAPTPTPTSAAPSMKAALAGYPPMPTPPPRLGSGPGFTPVVATPPRVIPPLPEQSKR